MILTAFDVDAFHSLAFSMGGRVAQALAARDPSRTRSLTLIGSRGALNGQIQIADTSPTLAAVISEPVPADHDGRVCWCGPGDGSRRAFCPRFLVSEVQRGD